MTAEHAPPSLRVLHVVSALGVGGAETWLMSLMRNWAGDDRPYRVRTDFLLTSGQTSVFDAEAVRLGARLFYVPYSRNKLGGFARGLRRALAEGRYHAIHDHQDVTAGFHFLFGLGLLPRVRIAHVHNPIQSVNRVYGGSAARRATAAAGRRLVATLGTHVLGTSREAVTENGFDAPPFRRLKRGAAYCGFDVGRFGGDYPASRADICREFGFPPDAKLVLFAGRLDGMMAGGVNQKNPTFALEVGHAAVARDPRVRLLMAGAGDDARRDMEAQVRGWGLADRVRLIGPRTDIARLMVGCDLLLFPSIAEGLGMVAVEAQAAGLPVLASTAVPREAVVVPDLVTFLPLDAGAACWAGEALAILGRERPDPALCNRAVRDSPFSIANSAARLVEVYRGGRLPASGS